MQRALVAAGAPLPATRGTIRVTDSAFLPAEALGGVCVAGLAACSASNSMLNSSYAAKVAYTRQVMGAHPSRAEGQVVYECVGTCTKREALREDSNVGGGRSYDGSADKEGETRHDPIRAADKRGHRYRKHSADLGGCRVEISVEWWHISAEQWDIRLAVPKTCLLRTLDFLHAR